MRIVPCVEQAWPHAIGPIQSSAKPTRGAMDRVRADGRRERTNQTNDAADRDWQGGARRRSLCCPAQLTEEPTGERSIVPVPNGAPATVSDGSSLGWLWFERAVSS